MFIDDVKNRYTYLNSMKNIVHQEPLDRPVVAGRELIIHPAIPTLLDRLMKERPTWRFKSEQHLYTNVKPRLTHFEIYDGDEQLGRLWVEHHWRDETVRYFFINPRIHKDRERGGAAYSTKPEVAAKRILKSFHLKTPSERAAEAGVTVRKSLNEILSNSQYPVRRVKNTLENQLFRYAVTHWDTIKHNFDADVAKLDLPALVQENNDALAMFNAMDNNDGFIVRIESNGAYLVSCGESNSTFTDSTLSDHMRGALGLLKLLDDNSYVPNVGVRVRSNLYFVRAKQETEA